MTTVHLVNPSALVTVEIKKHLGKNSFQLVSAVVTSVLLPYTYANLLSVCNGLLSDLPRIPLNLGSRSIWNLLMYSNSSSVPSTFAILTSCQSKTRTTETLHYLQLSIIKVVCKWSWFARQFVKNWQLTTAHMVSNNQKVMHTMLWCSTILFKGKSEHSPIFNTSIGAGAGLGSLGSHPQMIYP